MIMQNPESDSFEKWAKDHGMDPIFGFMYPPDYQPQYFNKKPLKEALEDLRNKIIQKRVTETVQKLPSSQLKIPSEAADNYFILQRDCYMLHCMANILLSAYIYEQKQSGIQEQDIIVPKNLGLPIYQTSKFLKMKYGMSGEFFCMWALKGVPKDQPIKQLPQELNVQDLEILYNFTQLKTDEGMFFGGSIVGSYYFFKNIKILYELDQNIDNQPFETYDRNIALLQQINKNIKKIMESNFYILNNVDNRFMTEFLIKFVHGFKNLKFEGVEEKLTSFGGAGGFDPVYQIFEKAMGIVYQGPQARSQQRFRSGFPPSVIKLLSQLQQRETKVKDYFALDPRLAQAYNTTVQQYSSFYYMHRGFLSKFIKQIKPDMKEGGAGLSIYDIQDRAQSINRQRLSSM